MALKPLPALPKLPSPTPLAFSNSGGAYDPNRSTWINSVPSSYGSIPTAPSASGGFYDPNRSLFIPGLPGVPSSSGSGSGAGTGPGTGPGAGSGSYLDELQGDPMYRSAMQAFNNAISGGQAALADQIKQQVIRSGYDIRSQMPASLAGQWGGAIDQSTLDAAAANPMSTRAQLQLQLAQGQGDLNYNLAARGMERGGGQATGNTQLQNAYDTQSYGAMNSLLDAISQGSQNYAQFAANQTLARNQAMEAVAQRLAMMQYGATYGQGGGQQDWLTGWSPNQQIDLSGAAGGGGVTSASGATQFTPAQLAALRAMPINKNAR